MKGEVKTKIGTWKGVPLEKLSRKELYEAIITLNDLYTSLLMKEKTI